MAGTGAQVGVQGGARFGKSRCLVQGLLSAFTVPYLSQLLPLTTRLQATPLETLVADVAAEGNKYTMVQMPSWYRVPVYATRYGICIGARLLFN